VESLKGTRDFFPEEMRFRRWLEDRWRGVAEAYGYQEVDGPVLEPLELYSRKSGEEIVRQLYRFTDQGQREVALRPEMTPSLTRMLLERAAALPKPIRWYSIPRLFRYERPQRGRLREFFQLNMDLFGVADETADAELICAASDALRAVGLADSEFRVYVNDRRLVEAILSAEGIAPAQRPGVLAAIDKLERAAGTEAKDMLAAERISRRDAERVLSLFRGEPRETVAGYPSDSDVARAYRPLERLQALVEAGGAGAVVEPNLRIVRGLAYYTGIVFEIFATRGDLRAVCGGGRYDDLLADMGGGALPAVGFGLGDVVLEEVLRDLGKMPALARKLDLYVIPATEDDLPDALALARDSRKAGLIAETALRRQPVGKQLGRAAAAGARFAVVVGETERASGRLVFRDLLKGEDLPIETSILRELGREKTAAWQRLVDAIAAGADQLKTGTGSAARQTAHRA
jgi:histidyl-tRNA synthetase